MASSWASAAAQATGLPRNVLVWIASPSEGGHAAMTPGVPIAALSGRLPVNALPSSRMSGTTSQCWQANQRPVRPRPQ